MAPARKTLTFNRRQALSLAGAAALAPMLPGGAFGQERSHGLSVFGDLKYAPDFTAFDYVNADAPKGGRMVVTAPNWAYNQNPSTFNTLNGHVTRGDAPPRIELVYDSLMAAALDEPNTAYGLVAESVSVSGDGNAYTFHLRPEARFHDGAPLTAADVKFSLEILKEKGETGIRVMLEEMAGVDVAGPYEAVVRFTGNQSLLLPLSVVGLPIFPRHYWQGRDFEASTLEPPLGSGPYRVGDVSVGKYIEYERVPDYWGWHLPAVRGHNNFDVVRIEFYRDRITQLEAFKKGAINWREEFTSKEWATGYDFPAVQDGRVKLAHFPAETRPKLQAWFLNARRAKFADPRTRRAVGLAFDFEWTNRNLFYDSYERAHSWFEDSIYAAEGSPGPQELAVLEPFRGQVPEAAFGEAVMAPASDGSGRDRRNRARAAALLREAGWVLEGGRLVGPEGEPFEIEFLINGPVFERVLGKYVDALKLLGIEARTRLVDPAQYQRRVLDFDYDVIGRAFSFSATPIESLASFFRSDSRDNPGSNNYAGIADPVVDSLVEQARASRSREQLVVALKALDRVLRASYYTVPNWTSPHHRVAHWDMFGIPETKPDYGFPFELTWWYDEQRARVSGIAN